MAQILSGRRRLGREVQAVTGRQPARPGGSSFRAAPLHLFHGKTVELRRGRGSVRPRGQGPAGARRRRRRQSRLVAAQHAHLRDLLLRRAESGRDSRQFQSALQCGGARIPDSRQRHQDHGDARSGAHLREDRGAAQTRDSRQGRGRKLHLAPTVPEISRLQAAGTHQARQCERIGGKRPDRARAGVDRQ